jgi:hypothetical protein
VKSSQLRLGAAIAGAADGAPLRRLFAVFRAYRLPSSGVSFPTRSDLWIVQYLETATRSGPHELRISGVTGRQLRRGGGLQAAKANTSTFDSQIFLQSHSGAALGGRRGLPFFSIQGSRSGKLTRDPSR